MPVRSTSSPRTLAAAATLLALSTVCPPRVSAQIELSTSVGMVVPARTLVEARVAGSTDTTVLVWSHRPAASVGARLMFWLSGRLALEAALFYSESKLERPNPLFNPDAGVAPERLLELRDSLFRFGAQITSRESRSEILHATLLSGTARARVRLRLSDASFLHLMAGLGFLSRGGDAYIDIAETSDLAFVAGAGLAMDIAPHIALRVDLEDYMTSPSVRFPHPLLMVRDDRTGRRMGVLTERGRFQHYLVIAPAVSIRLTGF
jgi:hypothetical protein